MLMERLRELASQGSSFEDAVRKVRTSSVFTTHTPVPAGHDRFSRQQLLECVGRYWEDMGLSRETFLGLGRHPTQEQESFHMTVAAIKLSGQVNAVSARHGGETRQIWKDLWPGRDEAQVPITHVTNGVHAETWMANRTRELLDRRFGPDWVKRLDDPGFWPQLLDLDDGEVWATHHRLKRSLLNFMREEAAENALGVA